MKSHVATRALLRASAPNVASMAGLPLSKQQGHHPKCCAQLAIAFFWHTNWQFPVLTNYSLFRRRKFPDTKRTGNLPQALQIVMRFCARHRQNDPKQIEFVKIPCYFPCCQGIHEPLGDARTPQPGSRRAKGRHFFDQSTLALAGPPARPCRGKDPTSPKTERGKHHAGAPDFTSL
jgi:hypothetical protein